jgi:CDP-glucose 4,6-dehydratase
MFNQIYRDKKVLITGHTGFKGTWLTSWLLKLGATVCGYSKDIPTTPSMFEALELNSFISHNIEDIRDAETLEKVVREFQPDFVFHLAAQPIVSVSYESPLETISTNVLGTAVVLDALRKLDKFCAAVIITSDKCYENVEWIWGYKETDALGGKDIYSGSKGAAEIIFHAYQYSFFNSASYQVRLATGRAGNVIGGGDWADDRIVADCMRAWSQGEQVEIRCPNATRPWQHVLEPLSGYLCLAQQLYERQELHGEQFNFGPRAEQNRTVENLLSDLSRYWDFKTPSEAYSVTDNIPFHEAGLLKLNCDKALGMLKWQASLSYQECIRFVSEWYYRFYNNQDMFDFTNQQISEYEEIAKGQGVVWAK